MACRRNSFSPLKPGAFEPFDPLHSHRAFCPWVSPGGQAAGPKSSAGKSDSALSALDSISELHTLLPFLWRIGPFHSALAALPGEEIRHVLRLCSQAMLLPTPHRAAFFAMFAGLTEGRVGWRWCLDSLIPAPGSEEEEAGSGQPADQRTKLLALLRSFG